MTTELSSLVDHAEQPLRVEIVDGRLLISIGVKTLCDAVALNPEYNRPDGESAVTITDASVFAHHIKEALQAEAEDGTTLVHVALDRAAEMAIEDGAEGVEYDEGTLE